MLTDNRSCNILPGKEQRQEISMPGTSQTKRDLSHIGSGRERMIHDQPAENQVLRDPAHCVNPCQERMATTSIVI